MRSMPHRLELLLLLFANAIERLFEFIVLVILGAFGRKRKVMTSKVKCGIYPTKINNDDDDSYFMPDECGNKHEKIRSMIPRALDVRHSHEMLL